MLTREGGPVVASEKTLRALAAIRRDKFVPELYGRVTVAKSVAALLQDVPAFATAPDWWDVADDRPSQALSERLASATPSEVATLKLAVAIPASLVLLDGPIKDRAKLSYIKAEGTVAILVAAFRQGKLNAVKPMVNALRSLGHEDVLPPPEALDALWKAIDKL